MRRPKRIQMLCAVFLFAAVVPHVGVSAAEETAYDWASPEQPGVTLKATEISRRREPNGTTTVEYSIQGTGLPDGEGYSILVRDLLGRQRQADGLWMKEGVLSVREPDSGKWRSFVYSVGQAVGGESNRLAVVSSDGKHAARTRVVPHPIEAQGEGGCAASALHFADGAYLVVQTGFKEGTEVSSVLTVESWKRELDFRAGKGKTGQVVDPRDSGLPGGVAVLRSKSEACSLELRLPFGKAIRPL